MGGLRVLELAAESREASQGKGARYSLTSKSTSSLPKGEQHDNGSEEECRDGRTGEVWRRRSSGSTAADEKQRFASDFRRIVN
jgi:hypothetical protein